MTRRLIRISHTRSQTTLPEGRGAEGPVRCGITPFEGNYEDYEKDRKKLMGADQPHRIKCRRIDA